MMTRKLILALTTIILIASTSSAPADAGGLLKRLFGKRCQANACRQTTSCTNCKQTKSCCAPASSACGQMSLRITTCGSTPCWTFSIECAGYCDHPDNHYLCDPMDAQCILYRTSECALCELCKNVPLEDCDDPDYMGCPQCVFCRNCHDQGCPSEACLQLCPDCEDTE